LYIIFFKNLIYFHENKGYRNIFIIDNESTNKGISASTGKFIGIINSDDWYETDVFKNILDLFKKSQYDIVCGLLRLWEDDVILGIQGNTEKFLKYGMISHPTCFIKRDVYESIGLFNTEYKIAGDYDFMMICLNNNYKFIFSEMIIANFRLSGISNSNSNLRICEFYEIQQKNKLITFRKYLFEILKQKFKKFF
jgi:hypothetical protein